MGGLVVDAGAFELRQFGEGELAITGAAGDDHRAGMDDVAAGDGERKRLALAAEPRDLAGDDDVGAELARLGERLVRQRLARDADGKAEVVLDPRARARLSTRGVPLQHQHVEALRGGVDRRGQPGRPGADDDQVAHHRQVQAGDHPDALGHLLVGRVFEHPLAPTDDHGHLIELDSEAVEQGLHARIAIHIQVDIRVAVAGQKLLHSVRAPAETRADEHQAAELVGDERGATQEEGAHEDVAQLRVGLDHAAERIAVDLEHLAVLAGASPHQALASGQQTGLAGETAAVVHGDRPQPGGGRASTATVPDRTTWSGRPMSPGWNKSSPATIRR